MNIRSFVGPNGGGKTLAMVHMMALPSWERGRPTVANFELYPEVAGYSAELARPLTSWREIPELEGCTLLLDEITAVLPSRQHQAMPVQLGRVLNQLRKQDVQLGWSAPNWARCDVMLREVTQAVTVCVGRLPDRWEREAAKKMWPAKKKDDEGKPVRWQNGWRPNRWFVWKTFDAIAFDEFSISAVKDIRPSMVERHWRSNHLAHRCYSTLEAVHLLDHLDETGTCVGCGGTRTRPRCSCPRPQATARSAEPEAEQTTGAEPGPGHQTGPGEGTQRPRSKAAAR